jgi:hypothetical protein
MGLRKLWLKVKKPLMKPRRVSKLTVMQKYRSKLMLLLPLHQEFLGNDC